MSSRRHEKRQRSPSRSPTRERFKRDQYHQRAPNSRHPEPESRHHSSSNIKVDWKPRKMSPARRSSRYSRSSSSSSYSSKSSSSSGRRRSRSKRRAHDPKRKSKSAHRSHHHREDRYEKDYHRHQYEANDRPKPKKYERENQHYKNQEDKNSRHYSHREYEESWKHASHRSSRDRAHKEMERPKAYEKSTAERINKEQKQRKGGKQLNERIEPEIESKVSPSRQVRKEDEGRKQEEKTKYPNPETQIENVKPQKEESNKIVRGEIISVKQNGAEKRPAAPAEVVRRAEKPEPVNLPPKEKVNELVNIISEAKRNLEIPPFKPNFLILDSFRTMNKLKAETLDPVLLSELKKDSQNSWKQKKEEVFSREIEVGERRESAWVTACLVGDESEMMLRGSLESHRGHMFGLEEMFRQLILLEKNR